MSGYTQVFGGSTIYPSEVSYLPLTLTADVTLSWPLESDGGSTPASRVIDVTANGAYVVNLPDATLTAAGQTILFNSLTASVASFTVKDAGGGTIAVIAPGEVWQLYLADTSTAAGTWRVFRYGASTATVQPSQIAGYGMTVISNALSQSMSIVTFTSSPRAVLATDRASAFVWQGSGAGVLNLPAAASVGNNYFIAIRNAGGGIITIDPSGSETINSAATLDIQPGDSAFLATDGLAWFTFGLGQQAVFAFDYTSIALSGGTYTLSGTELNRITYKFVGALASDATVVVPSTIQQYWLDNSTTGSFALNVKTASGTGVIVGQGTRGIYYCDGTNFIKADTSTVSLPVVASDGGTGITNYTTGDLLYASGATTLAKLSDVATGNVLISGGVGVIPAWGKVGLTTHVTGILPQANGGLGTSDIPTARANLGATTVGSNLFTLTNPTAVTFLRVNADNTVSALDAATFRGAIGAGTGNGTVTSVALAAPAIFTVTGSPLTTSGTLTLSLASQNANTVWAGPTTGVAAAPTFRALVTADIQAALPFTVAADIRTGTDSTKVVNSSSLSGSAAFQTLTYGATTTWNLQAGYNAKVTLTGNTTLAVSNPQEGLSYVLLVYQDATGSRTVTWPASFNWGTAGAPTLTTTANKHDVITLICTNAATPTFDAFLGGKGF